MVTRFPSQIRGSDDFSGGEFYCFFLFFPFLLPTGCFGFLPLLGDMKLISEVREFFYAFVV